MKQLFLVFIFCLIGLSVQAQTTYTWTGASNGDVSNPDNYNPYGSPTGQDDVNLTSSGHQPDSGSANVQNLSIGSGCILSGTAYLQFWSGGSCYVDGIVTGTATIASGGFYGQLTVTGTGSIDGGTIDNTVQVHNNGIINGGSMHYVDNSGTINGGTIHTIQSSSGNINGGTFTGYGSDINCSDPTAIHGGYFVNINRGEQGSATADAYPATRFNGELDPALPISFSFTGMNSGGFDDVGNWYPSYFLPRTNDTVTIDSASYSYPPDSGTCNAGTVTVQNSTYVHGGTFNGTVNSLGEINGGVFNGRVGGGIINITAGSTIDGTGFISNSCDVSFLTGSTVRGSLTWEGSISLAFASDILSGTFNGNITFDGWSQIYDGIYNGTVTVINAYIYNGVYKGSVVIPGLIASDTSIEGGDFSDATIMLINSDSRPYHKFNHGINSCNMLGVQ